MISGIIGNLISSFVEKSGEKLLYELRKDTFIEKINKLIDEYVKNHDGTIIVTGDFENFVTYQKPIEKIFDYLLKASIDKTEDGFVSTLTEDCLKSVGNYSKIDESIVKELFENILYELKNFLTLQSSEAQQFMVHEINQNANSNTERILNAVKAEIGKKNAIGGNELISEIYECYNNELLSGNLGIVEQLLTIIKGKNDSLENAFKIKLKILREDGCRSDEVLTLFNKITHKTILDDIGRVLVLYYTERKDILELINKNDELNLELKEIIAYILSNQWEKIFTIDNAAGIEQWTIHLKFTKNGEDWLIRRLVFKRIERNYRVLPYKISCELLRNELSFVEKLIIEEKKIQSILVFRETNNAKIEPTYEYLKANEVVYTKLNYLITEKYYHNLFVCMFLLNKDYFKEIWENLDEGLKKSNLLMADKWLYGIKAGVVNSDELIEFTLSSKNYAPINTYLGKKYDSPKEIIEIVDSCKVLLKNNTDIFLMTLHAYSKCKSENDVRQLVDAYGKYHENNVAYWMSIKKIQGKLSFAEIYQKMIDTNMLCDIENQIELSEGLIQEGKLKEARILADLLLANSNAKPVRFLDAYLSLNEGKEIESLNKFVVLFEDGYRDVAMMKNILSLSYIMKRAVDVRIIQEAEGIDDVEVWKLLALVHEEQNNHSAAKSTITKALMSKEDHFVDIYATFFEINGIDVEGEFATTGEKTQIILKNIDTGELKIYCVHERDMLPYEFYIWNGATHIYKESLIKLGLFRKKEGDSVTIDGANCIIVKIDSIDIFLLKVCMDNMEKQGMVQKISVMEDEHLNYELFKKWFQENGGDKQDLIQRYFDPKEVPVTFFAMTKQTRLSYSQLIMSLMDNENVVVREFASDAYEKSEEYILGCSAVVMMYKLGVDIKYLKNTNIVMSKTSQQFFETEAQRIYEDNNRDTVAFMGSVDGELFMHEATEEEKSQAIDEALKLNSYVKQIRGQDNIQDVTTEKIKVRDLKSLIGIYDYDALAIAVKENKQLVTGEIMFSGFSKFGVFDFGCKGILDFLCSIDVELSDLFDYMMQMVEFKFDHFLTLNAVEYVVGKTDEIKSVNPDEYECFLIKWAELLFKGDELGGKYKEVFTFQIIDLLLRNKDLLLNRMREPFIYYLILAARKYSQEINNTKKSI